MKKIILSVLILISVFAFPLLSYASYIIHLKGGGQYITTKYWEEDDQIKFFVSGGTMGIDKETVRKIEKSTVEPEDVYETKKPSWPPVTDDKNPAAAVNAPAKEEPKKDVAKTEIRPDDLHKDPAITKEFQQLQKSFTGRYRMTVDELNSLKNDLTTLWNKIVARNLEANFQEEEIKINDMKFFINDLIIIKSRNR